MGGSQTKEPPASPPGPTREEKLKKLETKGIGVESWSVYDVIEYLALHDIKAEELSKFIDSYKLDGESILNLGPDFFETVPKDKIPHDIFEKFKTMMATTKDSEMKNQIKYTVGYKPLDEIFTPHIIPEDPIDIITFYHDATKNTPTSGSRSLNHDWTQQPRVFRRYYGATCHNLGKSPTDIAYDDLYKKKNANPLSLDSLSQFFYLSLSLSGRKPSWQALAQPRSAYSKRVNASSGGLHPVEAYVFAPRLDRLESGVYHYSPKEHCLELRANIDLELPEGCFLVAIATATWREIWKYGERGFRYTQLDVGHAYASCVLSAAFQGWNVSVISEISDASLKKMLGMTPDIFAHEAEVEHPALLAIVSTSDVQFEISEKFLEKFDGVKFQGKPNQLSYAHVVWPLVKRITEITEKKNSMVNKSQTLVNASQTVVNESQTKSVTEGVSAITTIRTRRSALEFSPKSITLDQFVQFLHRIFPENSPNVWESIDYGVNAQIGIYVYRVSGLPSGYYAFLRNDLYLDTWKNASAHKNFEWKKSLENLPLYLLQLESEQVLSKIASEASCKQPLVAQSAFCCSMFVNIPSLIKENAHNYRHAHYECGMIGQILYVEAFAQNMKATGLGCFIDDVASESFGLESSELKPVYHFTVGHSNDPFRYPPYNYEVEMFNLPDE